MQFDSFSKLFDTMPLSVEHPLSPEGSLFTYYPDENPSALHYHDFLEIGYCERGSGIFVVDGEVIPFSGKCVSIIYDRQTHIAKSISPEKSQWHFLYVDVTKLFAPCPNFLDGLLPQEGETLTIPSIIHYQEDEGLYRLVTRILAEAAECRENYLTAIRGLVAALLTLHRRHARSDLIHPVGNSRDTLMAELSGVLTYISGHYTEHLTIHELCSVANMSKSTLQRKMQACVGYAPLQYVHYMRMSHATALLRDRTIPISEVAARSGFSTLSSFNRSFLSAYGVSPSQWRK